MPVRPVVLAREEHAQLIRALMPHALMAYSDNQLAVATVSSNGAAFVSLEMLPKIDPTAVTVPIVVIIDESKSALHDTVAVYTKFAWISHVMSTALLSSPSAAGHLRTLFERLESGAQERQLSATGRGRKALLTTASRRDARFERMRAFFENHNVSPRLVTTIIDASEELIMNALYDAPYEAGYFETAISRDEDVSLPDYLACEISYGVEEGAAFVCMRDPFGSLTRFRLLEVLNRCNAIGGNVDIDPSRGGAGLGLWRVISAASTVAVHVVPGTLTELFVGFSMTDGRRGVRPVSMNLFFSRTSPAEDPFAPAEEAELLDQSISFIAA
jgi:hypothetical protein